MSYLTYKAKKTLNARISPSRKGKIARKVSQGTIIQVINGKAKVVDGVKWYRAKIDGKKYWVNAKLLTPITPDFRKLVSQKAKMVYELVIKLGCKHQGGAKTLSQIKQKRITTCATSVSVALQEAGVLRQGKLLSHTRRIGSSVAVKRKNTIGKAISGTSNLISGTYKIVKIGKTFRHMPAKYKKPGNILVYDSNIAIIRDAHSVYSTNNGASQKNKQGKYINNIAKSGYNFTSPILYVIVIHN